MYSASDELYDYEYPDEEDDLEFDDPDEYSIRCPHCDQELFDDADYCPRCGDYLLVDSRPPTIWRLTSVVILILIIAAILVSSMF